MDNAMKPGNVTGNVETRSIHKQIKKAKRVEKTGAGDFCAVFASSSVYQQGKCQAFSVYEILDRTLQTAIDQAAVAGMEIKETDLQLLLPPETPEDTLRRLVRRLDEYCGAAGIPLGRVHAEVCSGVNEILIQVTIGGVCRSSFAVADNPVEQDVIVAGFCGGEGSMLLAYEKEEQLQTRYPVRMIQAAQKLKEKLNWIPEAATAVLSNPCLGLVAGEGGIFKALWNLAEKAGVGLSINLKALPVRQETIEICNFLDVNPYELLSGGTLVMLSQDGSAVVETLQERGVTAAVVGHTMQGHDRIIVNEEETRYLEPGKPDELYRVLL